MLQNWLGYPPSKLGIQLPTSPVIYCDNIGATYLCVNPVFHSHMKHIALAYHFIRQRVQRGQLRIVHVSTKDQLVDMLPKPLPWTPLNDFCFKIGVVPHLHLEGHIYKETYVLRVIM